MTQLEYVQSQLIKIDKNRRGIVPNKYQSICHLRKVIDFLKSLLLKAPSSVTQTQKILSKLEFKVKSFQLQKKLSFKIDEKDRLSKIMLIKSVMSQQFKGF